MFSPLLIFTFVAVAGAAILSFSIVACCRLCKRQRNRHSKSETDIFQITTPYPTKSLSLPSPVRTPTGSEHSLPGGASARVSVLEEGVHNRPMFWFVILFELLAALAFLLGVIALVRWCILRPDNQYADFSPAPDTRRQTPFLVSRAARARANRLPTLPPYRSASDAANAGTAEMTTLPPVVVPVLPEQVRGQKAAYVPGPDPTWASHEEGGASSVQHGSVETVVEVHDEALMVGIEAAGCGASSSDLVQVVSMKGVVRLQDTVASHSGPLAGVGGELSRAGTAEEVESAGASHESSVLNDEARFTEEPECGLVASELVGVEPKLTALRVADGLVATETVDGGVQSLPTHCATVSMEPVHLGASV
ncbi:hypothetical protein HDU98_000856 [Podochytrium sp. JEL0797]|nr:hypothetical protein HDU98_000856 [Podochytrium sp. JEL0797]